MERRKIFAILLLLIAVVIIIVIPVLTLTPVGSKLGIGSTPSPTAIPATPTPRPTPRPVLTVRGTPPAAAAKVLYLVDMETQHVLINVNGVKAVPMASTTKIMTALIALQSGNLEQLITVPQSASDRVNEGGSSAFLRVGDRLTLHDLLYALMLPSGDDAAITIAETLGGTRENFVARMNLFAHRLRLFQTHFANPDGLSLTAAEDQQHYSSASDLTRLAEYALTVPLFATIVQTSDYKLPATDLHHSYSWPNTNKLLTKYKGMLGIKTGFTYAAGYCLVFAAQRENHTLIGVVLDSPNDEQRSKDVATLLDWGFALPLLPPT